MKISARPLTIPATAISLLMLGACSLAPDYERPEMAIPAAYEGPQATKPGATEVAQDWWGNFNDPELWSLMSQALANNLDIAAAMHRLEQAQGALRATNSSLLPQISAGGDASTTDTNKSTRSKRAGGDVSIGYAVDLWGLYRSQSDAAAFSMKASAFDQQATILLVQASVATTYFQVLSLKDRVAIAHESLDAAHETLRIVQARYDNGVASGLELSQQKAATASIEAGIPSLENQLAASQHALAVLLGQFPQGFDVKTTDTYKVTLPVVAATQPSRLLERRPDIRRAEAQLQAANANIGAARAAFFPQINLSAAGTIDWAASLGTSTGTSLAASLFAPIFSGGELEGNLQIANARRAELAAAYRKTVLTSFAEVEDALSTASTSERSQMALATGAEESKKAYDLALASYKAGAVDFLTVLDAQRSWLSSRDSAAQARLNQITAAVNLFIALGGGWQSPSA